MHVRLCVSSCFELKLGMEVGDGPTKFESILSMRLDQRSKVIQRSSCFRNALWKNPCPENNTLLGSKVMWGQLGSTGSQISK